MSYIGDSDPARQAQKIIEKERRRKSGGLRHEFISLMDGSNSNTS
jgi:hypothetical protein